MPTAFQVCNDFDTKVLKLSPVNYNHIPINIGNSYIVKTHSFQPCKADLYWFLFDICSDASGRINYTMCDVKEGGKCTDIYASNNKMSVSSQNDLRFVLPQNQLQMFSQYRHNKRKNVSYGMVWGGFNIELISTNTLIAFNVVKRNGVGAINHAISAKMLYVVQFDVVLINSGYGWNEATHTFTAPITGIYILNFSTITAISAEIRLVTQTVTAVYERPCPVLCYETSLETVTCSFVVKLEQGGSAYVKWFSTDYSYHQVSFRGFLYAPSSHASIAWSAVSKNPNVTKAHNDLDFDNVLVNSGEAFKFFDTSKVIIPRSGIYYVIFQTYHLPVDFANALFVNRTKHIEIITGSEPTRNRNSLLERSILLKLVAGTRLSLQRTKPTIFVSNKNPLLRLYIAGFLVTYF